MIAVVSNAIQMYAAVYVVFLVNNEQCFGLMSFMAPAGNTLCVAYTLQVLYNKVAFKLE